MANMQDIDKQQVELTSRLKEYGASLVGFGDVSIVGSALTDKFPVAISLAAKYDEKIVANLHIDETAFHRHLHGLRDFMRGLVDITTIFLQEWGYNCVAILERLIASNEELSILQTFPHKTAATCAGLGWIGKNCLLVTPEYGPRIRLATILTNARFKTAEPMTESRCGDCKLCVDACPYQAIKGNEWRRGVQREEMFDAYICNQKRLDFIPIIERKHAGGYCVQVCPVGKER